MKQIKKFQIGKKGLTQEFVEQLKIYFENSKAELVKVEILKSATRDKKHAKQIGEQLTKNLGGNFTYKLVGYVLNIRKWRRIREAL